jgi:PilZ domain
LFSGRFASVDFAGDVGWGWLAEGIWRGFGRGGSFPVEAFDIQANTRITGRLSDIARKGCYIDTISPFAVPAAVTLTITKNNQSFTTQANVVYSQIGMGMGLSFTTAEPEQLVMLGAWLDELGGGEHSEQNPPNPEPQLGVGKALDYELRDAFMELIVLLSRNGILNDSERQTLLRKLYRETDSTAGAKMDNRS